MAVGGRLPAASRRMISTAERWKDRAGSGTPSSAPSSSGSRASSAPEGLSREGPTGPAGRQCSAAAYSPIASSVGGA
jgi:hypothetical protein